MVDDYGQALTVSESGATEVDSWFAQNLREAREEQNMSQTALADTMARAGFSFHQTTIARIESGSRPVRIGEAEALSRIFHSTVAEMCEPPAGAGTRRQLRTGLRVLEFAWVEAYERLGQLFAARAKVGEWMRELGAEDDELRQEARQAYESMSVAKLFEVWKRDHSGKR